MWPHVARRSELLVHGIDLDGFRPTPGARIRVREELAISPDAIVACTVANLRREKDYPNLLRASREAADGHPHLRVIAVGQGALENEIRELHRELGLGSSVQLLGFRSDTADILAASDIFVLASAHEGFPLALMESMAAGLPVVATAVGGIPEAVDDGVHGLLVAPRDPHALAAAMLRLANDPSLRRRMGEAARASAQQFDIRRAADRQCEVYEELAAERWAGHTSSVD
jgi:glycosyltransferase involved in cell wall biosynthesis